MIHSPLGWQIIWTAEREMFVRCDRRAVNLVISLFSLLVSLAMKSYTREKLRIDHSHLRRTPPSREAFKHSGCESLLRISPTVTLYFEVELRRDSLPGTQQNTSDGWTGLSESASSRESRSTCFCLWPVAKKRFFSFFRLWVVVCHKKKLVPTPTEAF